MATDSVWSKTIGGCTNSAVTSSCNRQRHILRNSGHPSTARIDVSHSPLPNILEPKWAVRFPITGKRRECFDESSVCKVNYNEYYAHIWWRMWLYLVTPLDLFLLSVEKTNESSVCVYCSSSRSCANFVRSPIILRLLLMCWMCQWIRWQPYCIITWYRCKSS